MPQSQNILTSGSSSGPICSHKIISGPDSRQYLVSSFMVEITQQAFKSERIRAELQADAAANGPHPVSDEGFSGIAVGDIQIPVDPFPTDCEALVIHAEILALQAQWGISYKDAAH